MKKRSKKVLGGAISAILAASMVMGGATALAATTRKIEPTGNLSRILEGVFSNSSSNAKADCNVDGFFYMPTGEKAFKTAEMRNGIKSGYVEGNKNDGGDMTLNLNTKIFEIDGKSARIDKIEAVMSGSGIVGTEKATFDKSVENTRDSDYRFSLKYNTDNRHLEFMLMYVSLVDGTKLSFYVGVFDQVDYSIQNVKNLWNGSESGSPYRQ